MSIPRVANIEFEALRGIEDDECGLPCYEAEQ
jgi:hypothetical protein